MQFSFGIQGSLLLKTREIPIMNTGLRSLYSSPKNLKVLSFSLTSKQYPWWTLVSSLSASNDPNNKVASTTDPATMNKKHLIKNSFLKLLLIITNKEMS